MLLKSIPLNAGKH